MMEAGASAPAAAQLAETLHGNLEQTAEIGAGGGPVASSSRSHRRCLTVRDYSLRMCAESIEHYARGLKFQIFERGIAKQQSQTYGSLSQLPLFRYILSTMHESLSTGQRPTKLHPCPPPYPWHLSYTGGSRRGLLRFRSRRACEFLVNCMVCSMSHVALGFAC